MRAKDASADKPSIKELCEAFLTASTCLLAAAGEAGNNGIDACKLPGPFIVVQEWPMIKSVVGWVV